MITYAVYTEIRKNRKLGRSINQTAKFLQVSRQTVKKYWEMPNNEFVKRSTRERVRKRKSKCDKYGPEIAELLKDVPEIKASAIYDRLMENHGGEIDVSERTVRKKVNETRTALRIIKETQDRDYQAMEELDPGQQVQADFGEYHLRRFEDKGKRKKVYFFIMVLRYSRFKYVEFSDRKFTTKMAIDAHNRGFEYFQGVPREILYDQDKVFIKSENQGDLIESVLFRNYLHAMPFTMRVAKKADPETKGCVEKYVGFVKHNFLRGRLYKSADDLNEKALQWLERTGNKKICQPINERPVDRIELERQALFPLDKIRLDFEFLEIIPHKVNKDNTVTYKGVRYRVPYGTYNTARNHEVGVLVDDGRIFILNLATHDQLISHPLGKKGDGIVGEKEERPLSLKSADLVVEVTKRFYEHSVDAGEFLKVVMVTHQRYIPDQMEVILQAFEKNKDVLDKEVLLGTLRLCKELDYQSAHEFSDALDRKCELIRMDKSLEGQLSSERARELPESTVAAFCEAETEADDQSKMRALESMWEIVNEREK